MADWMSDSYFISALELPVYNLKIVYPTETVQFKVFGLTQSIIQASLVSRTSQVNDSECKLLRNTYGYI